MNETTLLQVSGLRKAFGGLVAVNDVDFQIKAGEVLGVIGPNGSGKSTLLDLITGETKKDRGGLKLNGHDISAMPPHKICHNKISRTFQLVRVLPTMTVEENVMVGLLFGCERRNISGFLDISYSWSPSEEDFLEAEKVAEKNDLNDIEKVEDLYIEEYQQIQLLWD